MYFTIYSLDFSKVFTITNGIQNEYYEDISIRIQMNEYYMLEGSNLVLISNESAVFKHLNDVYYIVDNDNIHMTFCSEEDAYKRIKKFYYEKEFKKILK